MRSPRVETVLESGIAGVAELLSSSMATSRGSDNGSSLVVKVEEIRRLRDYARVTGYLTSLSVVRAVHVERINQSSIRYRLEVDGGKAQLERIIALGEVLAPGYTDASAADRPAEFVDLSLKLIP